MSEIEAMQLARPLIDKLLNAYASWDDYIAHYIIGRGLFALSKGYDVDQYEYEALKAAYFYAPTYENINRKCQFSLQGIMFPAENQNKNPVLTYDDVWYKPSVEAKAWSEINILSSELNAISTKDLDSLSPEDAIKFASIKKGLTSFYNKKKTIPCISFLMIDYQELTECPKEKLTKYYDTALASFKKVVPPKQGLDSEYKLFLEFSMQYIGRMLFEKDWKRLDAFLTYLDDENTTNDGMCIIYGIYYFIRMKHEDERNKAIQYRQKTLDFFKRISTDEVFDEESILKELEIELQDFF